MKKIGFVDYYISEWHANNYPEWIKNASRALGEDFAVSYAWAELERSPEDNVTTDEWCKNYRVEKCASIAELCEKSDCVMILAPSNPEKHLEYAREVFKYGKRTYVDKTFAPDFKSAEAIFALADKHKVKFFSTSALRYAEELGGFSPSACLNISGGGRSLDEYIIHQIEMTLKIQGIGAKELTVFDDGGEFRIEIEYEDSRHTTLRYKNENSFAVADGEKSCEIKSAFFENLLTDILRFFSGADIPFDTLETLEVIKIRDGVISGASSPGDKILI